MCYAVLGSLAQPRLMSRRVPEANLDALGLKLRVPLGLESHFEPVWHEWLYRVGPKIIETLKPYHDWDTVRDNIHGHHTLIKVFSTRFNNQYWEY